MQAKRLLPFLLAIVFAILALVADAQNNAAAVARWQSADTPRESTWVFADDSASAEKIDVVVRDGGQILISANRPTPVKVFTILGQPVASRTIQPGTMRLRLPLRGIYILKAGETTKRINI